MFILGTPGTTKLGSKIPVPGGISGICGPMIVYDGPK